MEIETYTRKPFESDCSIGVRCDNAKGEAVVRYYGAKAHELALEAAKRTDWPKGEIVRLREFPYMPL